MDSRRQEYDVIVVGSGSGNIVVNQAISEGLSVALVDRGPVGGTCLNLGCIPSKMLIAPADRVMEVREAQKLGIQTEIKDIDFLGIMERMRASVGHDRDAMREGLIHSKELDFYEVEGYLIDDHTLQVGDKQIRGEKIVLAAGSRPLIPPIDGLDQIDYLTNETVLALTEPPKSLIIIGGGYIGAEYAHFFEAMGTQVALVEMLERLVPEEEPGISALLQKRLAQRMAVRTYTRVEQISATNGGCIVKARDTRSGEPVEMGAERLMLAAGRRPNADLLRVENAGIETDERGFIRANAYLETNVPHIWAFGDIIGKAMFRHAANREALIAWHNVNSDHKVRMDYLSVPHAVFSWPQSASVGLTEAQARREFKVAIGFARYADTAKGEAIMEKDGFAKVVVDRENGHILGLHVIGPYAPMLVQEGVTIMANAGTIDWLAHALHIHPALSEVIGDLPFVLHAHD
jgi:mycothione reductase